MKRVSTTSFLDRLLLPAGFKRVRYVWNRPVGDLIHVVDVQHMCWGAFTTINYGFFDSEAYRIMWNKPPPVAALDAECAIRFRAGQESGTSISWERSEPVNELAYAYVESSVLPFLDSVRSRDDLARLFEEHRPYDGAGLLSGAISLWLAGRVAQSKHTFMRLHKDFDNWWPRALRAIDELETEHPEVAAGQRLSGESLPVRLAPILEELLPSWEIACWLHVERFPNDEYLEIRAGAVRLAFIIEGDREQLLVGRAAAMRGRYVWESLGDGSVEGLLRRYIREKRR